MVSRTHYTGYRQVAALVGLKEICERRTGKVPNDPNVREFWSRLLDLCADYRSHSFSERQKSDAFNRAAKDLFDHFGPLLWSRPATATEARNWLYLDGEGYRGMTYEKDLFYDDLEDREFLYTTVMELMAKKAFGKGRKSEKITGSTFDTSVASPSAPPVQCFGSNETHDGHVMTSWFVQNRFWLGDVYNLSTARVNNMSLLEELAHRYFNDTQGGKNPDGSELVALEYDTDGENISVDCKACLDKGHSTLLHVQMWTFFWKKMEKIIPVFPMYLGEEDRPVFALLKRLPPAEDGRSESDAPLYQFWKAGGGYSGAALLAESPTPHSEDAFASVEWYQPNCHPSPELSPVPTEAKGKKCARKSSPKPCAGTLKRPRAFEDEDDEEFFPDNKKQGMDTSGEDLTAAQHNDDPASQAGLTAAAQGIGINAANPAGMSLRSRRLPQHPGTMPPGTDDHEMEGARLAAQSLHTLQELVPRQPSLTQSSSGVGARSLTKQMPSSKASPMQTQPGFSQPKYAQQGMATGVIDQAHAAQLPESRQLQLLSTQRPRVQQGVQQGQSQPARGYESQQMQPALAHGPQVPQMQMPTLQDPQTRQMQPSTTQAPRFRQMRPLARSSFVAAQPSEPQPTEEPQGRFDLWVRPEHIDYTKVVRSANSKTTEELFVALQTKLGARLQGKKIESLFVMIPKKAGLICIEKDDPDEWEAVVRIMKEQGHDGLYGFVQVEAEEVGETQ